MGRLMVWVRVHMVRVKKEREKERKKIEKGSRFSFLGVEEARGVNGCEIEDKERQDRRGGGEGRLNRTRPDKARQGKTRQSKTSQDKTRHVKKQDKTRHDKTRRDMTKPRRQSKTYNSSLGL